MGIHGLEELKGTEEPEEVCPRCGFSGRQANVYRKGVLWSTCHDPWHNKEKQ